MCAIRDLEIGTTKRLDGVLLKKAEQRKTKNGKEYCLLTLRDGEQEIVVNFWEKRLIDLKVRPGTCIKAEVRCEEYQGRKTYTMQAYGPSNLDPASFTKKAPEAAEDMYCELLEATEAMPEDLNKITKFLLSENREKLLVWPAAMTVHHTYESGLLFHLVRLYRAGKTMAAEYNLDLNLMAAGTILHDIGKLRAYDMDMEGNLRFSVDGNLFGHVLLGIDMVNEACNKEGVPRTENVSQLLHIIASHHMDPEHGAIVRPATAIAHMIASLDQMDSKQDIYSQVSASVEPGTCSERVKYLNGAAVYHAPSTIHNQEAYVE